MTTLTPHLSSAALESAYKAAEDAVAKSHFHALWLVSKDYAVTEVAALLSFSARLCAHADQALQRERP